MHFHKFSFFVAFFFIVFFASSNIISAQENVNPEALAEAMIERIVEGEDIEIVLDESSAPIIKEVMGAAFRTNISQIRNIYVFYGNPLDYELFDEKEISERLVWFQYLLNYEKGIVIVDLYYYKGAEGWELFQFLFDSTYSRLLKD